MIYVSGLNSQISFRKRLLGSTTPCSKLLFRHQPHRSGILRKFFAKGCVKIPALRGFAHTSFAAESAIVIARAMSAEALLKEQKLGLGKLSHVTGPASLKEVQTGKKEFKSGDASRSSNIQTA